MSAATVLLSVPPTSTGQELHRLIAAAGFEVADHRLGSAPAVDFGPVVAAVIEVGDSGPGGPAAWAGAATQTRRWRAELGGQFLPVMWVAAGGVAAGLDAGADVVLARPIEPVVFAAHLRALARAHATAARAAARAGEARLLGDQLQKALAQLDREQEIARRLRAALLPHRFPQVGRARFHVCHRPRGRTGGDFYDVCRIDERHVGFFVADVVGTGAASGLLAVFVQQSVTMKEIGELSYRVLPPDELLTAVNRRLLALGADDLPLVAMLAGVLNCTTGTLALARAGFPAAVHVPAIGSPGVWTAPGPFLGAADTTYQSVSGTLAPGDRLLIGTDGTRPDGDPDPGAPDHLLEAASRHRDVRGPEFADAVGSELLRQVRHAGDFTLLCVEMAAG